jgi:hypothetical protein
MSDHTAENDAPWCPECGPTCPLHGDRSAEKDAVDQFITDAMNRGIIPMHVAADLSQYLVVEWSRTIPPGKYDGWEPWEDASWD